MTIHGPHFDPLYRIENVDYTGQSDKDRNKKKKKCVSYNGRQWAEEETDSDLNLETKLPRKEEKEEEGIEKKKSHPLFIEKLLLDKAKQLFKKLTTLEDKVAQLCFYTTEASYDPKLQVELGGLIREWQLGGVLFLRGSYRRQSYLIDHYQGFAKIPLLIGNDFVHNLSFCSYQKLPKEGLTMQHYRDLGKAIMGQNRSLGVHFLFDREGEDLVALNEEEKSSFRKGVRLAHGVVARDLAPSKGVHKIKSDNLSPLLTPFKNSIMNNIKNDAAEQFIGMRTLFLQECGSDKDKVLEAFFEGYEAFLIEGNLEEIVGFLSETVRKNQIREEELDRRVLKILVLKAYFNAS